MVSDAVARGWCVQVREIRYLPVGAGGYHWRLTEENGRSLFVTVDDLDGKDWFGDDRNVVAQGLNTALATARWLHDEAGLGFVLAPLGTCDGQSSLRLGDRYTVSVSPFLDGRSYPFGPHTDPIRRRHVLDALIALHSVTHRPGIPQHLRPRIGSREHLEAFLHSPGEPWHNGPFGEPARAFLTPHADDFVARLEAFDRANGSLTSAREVITHGEPHAANVMTVGNCELLFDWDTIGIAMPERDLWLVVADDADMHHYAAATGHQPNPVALALYRARWQFDDLGYIIKTLRDVHDESDGSARWHAELQPLVETMLTASR